MSALKWRKSSEWCLESDKGNYVVTKYMQGGAPLCQAIRMPDVSLLVAGNSEQCRSVCEADYRGRVQG